MTKTKSNLIRDFYDKCVKRWIDSKVNSFWHERQFRKFIKYFKKGDCIIDLGCAHGIHVPLFLGLGRHLKYEGLDISTKMLAIARSRYPQLKFFKANLQKPKTLPKKKYSGFWAGAVLMHIPESDWPNLLASLQGLIKPGGIGYLTLPRRRPAPESKKDRRFFSYWTPVKAKTFFKRRSWKVLNWGEMPKREAGWFWTIVQLPK